nr:TonB-dependent receptor [Thiorhodococcus mannitoliphagus]
MRQQIHSSTRRAEADLALEWSGWANHRWRLELSAAEAKLIDAWWAFNVDLLTWEPLLTLRRYTGDLNFIDEDARRTIQSLVLQDQWSVMERLEITAGLRYDRYSDVGDNLSPRLAAVWRLTNEHLLKAQIAEAFFPPTLLQVNGQSSILSHRFPSDAETARTTELGYIFRHDQSVARATLFDSQLKDLIVYENGNYLNRGEARLQGVEFEWEQRFGPAWKMLANLSYTDAEDKATDGPVPGSARWLGNLSLFYRPRPDMLLTGRWRYVGDRARGADDPRDEPLAGYNDLSLTFNWFNAGMTGLTLRAGVTNLLGETIRSPAPLLTYFDDYLLLDERAGWVQFSYDIQ